MIINRSFWKLIGSSLSVVMLALMPLRANAVELADAPLSVINVPGNLILALSVEFPTASTSNYNATAYSSSNTYMGYFDPDKCYSYQYNATAPASSYFNPESMTTKHECTGSAAKPLWSGNFLNYAAMQTLDTFRAVLTGGYRSVDTVDETILTKTYMGSDSNDSAPDRSTVSTIASKATPFSAWDVNSRIRGQNISMLIGSTLSGTVADYTGQNHFVATSDPKYANASTTYRVYINVKVCDSAVSLEDNCKLYGEHYKPEGLMQKYSSRLRYSAFGYYNDNNILRDGGVMRARMKFIGPTDPISGLSNSNTEWDPVTGIMGVNPDSSDATATATFAASSGIAGITIPNSGAMNYLNKFGYFAKKYKTYDNVSEMYYASTRYLRNLGNVASYTSLDGKSKADAETFLDGFPAITTWDDPIKYSCQQNFILGIGDVNTHADANLPGVCKTELGSDGKPVTTCAVSMAYEPPMPSEVTNDTTVNVTTALNMISTLEYGNPTTIAPFHGRGTNGTTYMGALAYDAHTKDIRSDMPGKQTVNTYWLDVVEYQQFKPANLSYTQNNQFWLAAKYGGFKVPADFDPYAATNNATTIPASSWWTSGDRITSNGVIVNPGNTNPSNGDVKRPDNFFLGSAPDRMKSGLTTAFEKIISETALAGSSILSSPSPFQKSSGNANYSVSYDANTWSSTLVGQLLDYTAGAASATTVWDATALLDNRTASDRFIVTWNTMGVPFDVAHLSAAQKTALGADAGAIVDYLRGDRSLENGTFRTRTHLLGDVVNAKLLAVSIPSQGLWESYNPGYGKFRSDHSSRPTIVYVGANDGMLHAFDGTVPSAVGATCTSLLTGSSCGKELFGYVPGLIYGDAVHGGLASLTNPHFDHRYLVDGTPMVSDVDFKNTYGATATNNDWRSVLIGGLGKGGKGYYAIDVTNPSDWTSETMVASRALWEFSDTHMGYSYGDPVVAKTPEFGWTVVLASGYNNDDDKTYLYLVNPRTGELLKTIALPEGSNFAHVTAYSPDYRDLTADAVYGGDLNGNLWRIDLTGVAGASGDVSYAYGVEKIAKLTAPDGTPQPVTIRPLVEIDPASGKRYVLIGTGQMLSAQDTQTTQTQTFYAIADGMWQAGQFAEFALPATRATLNENTDLLTGIGSDPALDSGWYFDLAKDPTTHITERVVIDMAATNSGVVSFAANLPNDDPCAPGGPSRVFALNFASGVTVLTGSSGELIASLTITAGVTEIAFSDVGGKTGLNVGGRDQHITNAPGHFGGPGAYKRLNWREVPSAD
ncbi:MAG: PilC/PilY family type IV pilus protein [Desulfobulbus sp.]|nr:PilC/PilY family type IV pilus protein [Desulfobulbus sp.]